MLRPGSGDAAPRPRLSVILCTYDMPREAPRTILSAGVPYQKDVEAAAYEVIVVDNGSTRKLDGRERGRLPPGVTLVDMPQPRPSPVFAMSWAARELARGDILLFAIDGARIFTDRLYAETLAAHDLVEGAFVYTLAWHLGPKVQMESTAEGYDREVEDRLIAESGWPDRPDGLFDIAVFAGSSSMGYFRPINESNAFSMRRELFKRLGGYDERFTSPGGGMCNLEIFRRYVTRPRARNVCLLSEGTFHQVHGGVATSRPWGYHPFEVEYREATGEDFEPPAYEALYLGAPRPSARRFLRQSLDAL
ncbi:MAG: glycosyltransferase [Thermoanaerobaculia bacterium]